MTPAPGDPHGSCVFCEIVAGRASRERVAEDEKTLAFMDTARRVAQAMHPQLGAEGVSLLNCCGEAAWQTVFHFHIHVIPRYRDVSKDRMQLPYEPRMPSDPRTRARCAGLLAAGLQASE